MAYVDPVEVDTASRSAPSLTTISAPPPDTSFSDRQHFGGYHQGTVWLRIDHLRIDGSEAHILAAGPWWVDRIDAFVQTPDDKVLRPLKSYEARGFFTPHSFVLPPVSDATIYVVMASATSLPSVLTVWAEDSYLDGLVRQRSFILVALGALVACVLLLTIYAAVTKTAAALWVAIMASGLGCFLAMDAAVLPGAWLAWVQGKMAWLNPPYILPAIIGGLGTLRWVFTLIAERQTLISGIKPLQVGLVALWLYGIPFGGTYLLQITNLLVIGFGLFILAVAVTSLWQNLWSSLGLLSLGGMVLGITLTFIPFTQPLLSSAWVAIGRLLLPVLLLAAAMALLIWALKRDANERERLRQAEQRDEHDHRRRLESEVVRRTEEAEKSRQLAEDLARVKERFVTAIAHDLRSPLTTIIDLAELRGTP